MNRSGPVRPSILSNKMSSETSKNGINNKEYMYVRRLISVLTNDDSEKLIVEKLKGKNLSSLLYNAKIIDNSKNMAANKRILSCVIRAIDREKQLCRRREIDQSWGRKLLSSFNCLIPMKQIDELSEPSYSKSCTVHKRMSRRNHRRQGLMRRRPNQSVGTESKTVVKNSRICSSGYSDRKTFQTNSVHVDAVDVPLGQCTFLVQKKAYETVCPLHLNRHRPSYVRYVYIDAAKKPKPTKAIPTPGTDKITSSTQTFECGDPPEKEQTTLPNNIKLQDLLEAATSLINTRDQKEYVKSFLSNFEPPFDLASGFPPYLKLPSMKTGEDFVSKESIYGSNSELSVLSGRICSRRVFECGGDEVARQKEDQVKKYVRELSDPWQETAESIISGVINETLPHDKADYSQLGACILKRLGAYPSNGFREPKLTRMNTTVPEIVLSCTEWFESGTGDSDQKNEKDEKIEKVTEKTRMTNKTTTQSDPKIQPNKKSSRESIEEIELLEGETDHSKVNWERQRMQNYCFFDGNSNNKVGLLDVSEGSITDVKINTGEEVCEITCDGGRSSQDRKHFPRRQALTISPSILNQASRNEIPAAHKNSAGDGTRWCDNHVNKLQKSVQERKPVSKGTTSAKGGRDVQNVHLKHLLIGDSNSSKGEGDIEETLSTLSATVENKTEFLAEPPEAPKEEPIITTYISTPEKEEPATLESILWEPTAIEVETYDGLGECHAKVTDSPSITKSPSDKKLCSSKSWGRTSLSDRFRRKKKCKNQGKNKKSSSSKDDVDLSRNCKVM